jgi:acyl-CoA thioesterase
VSDFEIATAVERTDENEFRASIDPAWWVVRGPHGGYIAAVILRTLMQTQNQEERSIRSFTTHFLRAPAEGWLGITTTIERAGRSMTFLSARVHQEGKTIALSLAGFSGPWTGFEFDDAPMPEVASPEEAFKVPVEGEDIPPFLGNFDMRWTFGERPFTGADQALVGGWMRLRDPVVADAPAIATLMDAWAPAIFPRATKPVIAPTLDLTIHFRSPVPLENAGAEDFYLGRFSSKLGREGFFEEDGELWSKDGVLLAQSRQLALGLFMG